MKKNEELLIAKNVFKKLYLLHGKEIDWVDFWIEYAMTKIFFSARDLVDIGYITTIMNKTRTDKYIITDKGIEWLMG